jgi:hypothetical protein
MLNDSRLGIRKHGFDSVGEKLRSSGKGGFGSSADHILVLVVYKCGSQEPNDNKNQLIRQRMSLDLR